MGTLTEDGHLELGTHHKVIHVQRDIPRRPKRTEGPEGSECAQGTDGLNISASLVSCSILLGYLLDPQQHHP